MKRLAAWILLAAFLLGLAGCAEEISREAIDKRYTAPYDSVETDYVHKYDMWKGEFVMVPEIHTVHSDFQGTAIQGRCPARNSAQPV